MDKITFVKRLFAISFVLCMGCGSPSLPNEQHQNIDEKQNSNILPTPNIKVYMENSGSMNGYVTGTTEFEYAVYSYLSDIELANIGVKDSATHKNPIELYYINSKILNQGNDIAAFIKDLEPYKFQQQGGNIGTSDISEILSNILSNHSENDISILISDCIFSPGKQYKAKDNADEYLVNQQIGIRNCFKQKLSISPDYSIIIMRLISSFDGYYYNKYDDKQKIKCNRPFYIWIMGNTNQLCRLMNNVDINDIKGSGVKHKCVITNINQSYSCSILPLERKGYFELDKQDPKTTIVDAKPDTKSDNRIFELTVGIDFSSALIDDEYLLDPSHYEVSNPAFSIHKIAKNQNQSSSYTHKIKLISKEPIISKGAITLSFVEELPQWVDDLTDLEGQELVDQEDFESTYGLKYLIGGVYDAYKDYYKTKLITINIK